MNNYSLSHHLHLKSMIVALAGCLIILSLSGCTANTAAPVVKPTAAVLTMTPTVLPTTLPTISPTVQPTTAIPQNTPTTAPDNFTELKIINNDGKVILLKVAVPELMTDAFLHGLENRATLPENQGMLFDWQANVTISFQMWHTSLPLSIAFISDTLQILDIQDMTPYFAGTYAPSAPYRYALEVNQGFFTRNNIRIGNTAAFTP